MSEIKQPSGGQYVEYMDQVTKIPMQAWIGIGAVAIATVVWMMKENKSEETDCKVKVDHQAKQIEYEGEEFVHASPLMKDKCIESLNREVNTLHDVFLHGLKQSEGGPCVGWRPGPDQPYKWLTYQQVLTRAQHFGSGLVHEGAKTQPEQFIGIFSQNRVEWKITEQACNSFSMVVVPLYDTLGPQSIKHIMTQCDLKIVVVDNNGKAKSLLSGVKEGQFTATLIIMMSQPNEEVTNLAKETDTKVMTFEQVEEVGKNNLKEFVPPKPEDLHTICYTSGTTGLPKGVMLTHGNLIANQAGVFAIGQDSFLKMNNKDVHISYLPLAHVFERLVAQQMYYCGASVGFFQGDVKLLLSDVSALKPTVFPMVPRLINRIYDKIWAGVSQSFIKKFLLERALKSKLALLKKGIVTRDTIWDKIVFGKVQNMMGGRGRIFITGAAPVSLEVINFMRAALGVNFTEGYGQTEATAAISITIPGDFESGSVGTPAVCNMIKLVDVPEKDYYAKEGKGEVCAKGPNIFVGYYKDPDKTKETLDEDGWLHTGDVGMWLPNGSLKIIDRKKNIFKLAQGEYIAPEKIEGIFTQSPAIAQVFMHGESLKASLVAVVIPDSESFVTWCNGKGVSGGYEELCNNTDVKKLVLEDMCALGRKRGLKSFELPKKIHLSPELFSVENELLTPTFKSRRPQLLHRYKAEIDEMYKDLD
uniref:long-chain-fatty-acid--CoA ligase 1-like n=1 Tax=Ciona intestinalis TaxID=7719 RepID=UPI000180B4F7|nr:long-chain-fatty-acid--CoA ligase 1-like [Ciona intestinalis]|eukprot:XP_002129741.1 long-chain-fatty-acid--CoA ligase 1-like [Ciona intestinalis]